MILCIGEILADLIGEEQDGITIYKKFAGGAPFNVACGLSNYGSRVKFLGNVGDDLIGRYLLNFSNNIENLENFVSIDKNHNTTLAFVENKCDGERSFSFFRKSTADYFINITDSIFDDVNIVHLGSLMLSEPEGRFAADKIIETTKRLGKLLSFDINYRDDIFASTEEAVSIYAKYSKEADILKFSEDEILLFTGLSDYIEALDQVAIKDQIIFLTLGGKGSIFYRNGEITRVPSIKVKPIDTTGAGDAFFAGVLYKLEKLNINKLDIKGIERILKFGNICGAIATTKKGAISSLPSLKSVEVLM